MSPKSHVRFGNVSTPSRWFSASHDIDPALFWSTRNVVDKRCTRNVGRNWDVQHIALIDLNRCDIYADISSAQLARTFRIAEGKSNFSVFEVRQTEIPCQMRWAH